MNPLSFQSSIGYPFSGNALYRPGSPLPRSFKLPSHEIQLSGALYALLIAHQCPSSPQCEKRPQGHSRASHGDTFTCYRPLLGASRVPGNSRAPAFSRVQGRETRYGAVKKSTFFSFGGKKEKKGFRGAASETYTLLDYIALSFLLSKNLYKGH